MRPEPLLKLLESVKTQSLYPDEILIIDSSTNNKTELVLEKNQFDNLHYYMVTDENRGLTKQRNFGISNVSEDMEVICFLDDDTVLQVDYFEQILHGYKLHPEALGVGGYIINNNADWKTQDQNEPQQYDYFYFDGWKRKYSQRFILRKKLKLLDNCPPGIVSDFAHGKAMSYFPPNNKIYKTEFFLGGVSSFKKTILESIKFSEYFEGYGLYEDADFTIRVSKVGSLYINTAAKLYHYHSEGGRPNKFEYGKMVLRNGWYVWRVSFPKPTLKARIKWNLTTFLLIAIRTTNIFNTSEKIEAFTEVSGRIYGWFSILFNPPKEK
ncbi:glycosyltransferase family 2 protein [Flavobacterium pectinovorum]|uniref:glycosyltransferase family 2 protein n=1 Tax=Flavobacterium pectinovorum TaxID=29533 RepID=UPI00265FEE1E|nr:glycosyltransferase family 2 protein [Flavobacterium pectinovorum]WKL45956.1 glycosyltransferase family 2 protein [Flavobacterium pectinovorum]